MFFYWIFEAKKQLYGVVGQGFDYASGNRLYAPNDVSSDTFIKICCLFEGGCAFEKSGTIQYHQQYTMELML